MAIVIAGVAATLAATQPAADRGGAVVDLSTPAARAELMEQLRENIWRDRALEEQYTYVERRRDVKISRLGKVALGPVRTFEVYPSATPGRTYKRLIAVDGVPLAADELARRDAQHRSNMIWEKQRREQEAPAQRIDRERREAERVRRQRRELEEAFAAFDITPVGRASLEGFERPLLMLNLTARPQAPASSDLVKYLKKVRGTAWVDPDERQLARVELEAAEAISIGWGVVGRVHAGSRAWYERRKLDDLWVPSWARVRATGRTLLFRPFEVDTEWVWDDYRKYAVETAVIGAEGQ